MWLEDITPFKYTAVLQMMLLAPWKSDLGTLR